MSQSIFDLPTGNYVVFDLETTGSKTPEDDIVEIAAVRCSADGSVTDTFEALIKPCCQISYSAMKVHGITEQDVAHCPSLQDVFPKFLAFIGDCPLVGHNINAFDMRFLDDACCKTGLPKIQNARFDTLPFARVLLERGAACSVAALIDRFGLEARHAHRAMPDVLMERDVFLALRNMYRSRKNETVQLPGFSTVKLHKKGKPSGLYVEEMADGTAKVEIEGYFILRDIVRTYGFLHWKKTGSKWWIAVDAPAKKHLEVLRCEAKALGCSVFIQDKEMER